MTENVNFLDSATENWTEANWHKVAKLLNAVDGVLEDSTSKLAVIQATPAAMSVIVGTGMAWINGLEYDNTAAKTITIDAADGTNTRYDYIVIEADFTGNTCVAKVVKGTAAASPVAPTLTQTDGVLWQFPLALVTVGAGVTSILTANISDVREYLFGSAYEFVLDGGGTVIAAGNKAVLQAPFSGTITSWSFVGIESGSIVANVKKATYSAWPTLTEIDGSEKPTITTAYKNTSSTLSGWTTTVNKGDWIVVTVESCSTITHATLALRIRGSG